MDELKPRLQLQALRLQAGLSLTDAARGSGIPCPTLHQIETHEYLPNMELGIRLAKFYRTSLDELIDPAHRHWPKRRPHLRARRRRMRKERPDAP